MLKKTKLRYNEYHDMQHAFDELYQQSQNNNNFYKLMEVIGSEENVRLAYRNLRSNSGSKTKGTDGLTIKNLKKLTENELIEGIRNRLEDYHPLPVRRVYIPKPGTDKKRPLGIPTIWDRLVQQCILQVLEPICEPKFHNHSYGFRPNRSTHHAISRMMSLINIGKNYYCVDVDIKGFFDNVNHGKLMKQLWSIGIRDKRLLSVISKLLKCEIDGEGVSKKGTPQGGILSPLLSNVVLNELDWWISDQWETYKPNRCKSNYSFRTHARLHSNMKEGYLIRYADDFKVLCKTYVDAQRYYHAIKDFLQSRLGLEISEEKSKVTNMRKNSSEFLGFKIKVVPKGTTINGYIAKTDLSRKAMRKVKDKVRCNLLEIQKHTVVDNINRYNSTILGIQNYYRIATNVYNNLDRVNYSLLRTHYNRLRRIAKIIKFRDTSESFKSKAIGISDDKKIYQIKGAPLLPLTAVHHKPPMNFSQDICNYTEAGRTKIHAKLKAVDKTKLKNIQLSLDQNETIEFCNSAVSRFVAQYGKCFITGKELEPSKAIAIHIIPKEIGGSDAYDNVVIIDEVILSSVQSEQQPKGFLMKSQRDKLNRLRRARNVTLIK